MAASSNFLGINTGIDAKRAAITSPGGIPYVLCYVTDTGRLWFFDGVTAGGIELAMSGDLPSASAPLPVGKGGTGAAAAGAIAANNIGALAVANDLSDVGTLATAQANIGLAGCDNRIVNGDMLIDQRNAGGAHVNPANNTYTLDRWRVSNNASASFTIQQQTSSPPAPYSYYFLATATAANSFTSSFTAVGQRIEASNLSDLGFGTASAKNIFVSFWLKSSATGNFGVSLQNNGGSRSYAVNVAVPIANVWQYVTVSVPGDTGGTWPVALGTVGLTLTFSLGISSSYQTSSPNTWVSGSFFGTASTTNFLASNGATIAIAHVRLFAGTVDAPYFPRSYGAELDLCRRYYQSSFPPGTAAAQAVGKAGAFTIENPIAAGMPSGYVTFGTPLMGAPTIATYNPINANANWNDLTASADVTASVDPKTTAGVNGFILGTSGTVSTSGDILAIHWSAQSEL